MGQAGLFGHRQRIHVGADGDAGPSVLEHGDHAGAGDAGPRLQAEGAQLPGDRLRGARLLLAPLRVPAEVAAPGHPLQRGGGGRRGFRLRGGAGEGGE